MKTRDLVILCVTACAIMFMVTSCAIKTEKNSTDVSIEFARNGFARDAWGHWVKK